MQEKDIREKLNQELEEMAPDMLNKILSTPMEPVKSEKELFGKERPLFKDEKNWKQYFKVPAIAALAACFVALIIILYPMLGMNNTSSQVAFSIIVDVNPSISIDVNEDGTVKKINAENRDAKQIVQYVKSELDKDADYKTAMKLIVKNLKKEGYLQNKENAMLVSTIPVEKNQDMREQFNEVKTETEMALKHRKIQCKTVYQKVKINDKIKKVAAKNDVSVGKAALCIELAKEENVSVSTMCKKNIVNLVKEIENYPLGDDIFVVGDNMELVTEETSVAVETVSLETENTEETTVTMESQSEVETVVNPVESTTVPETVVENNTIYTK